jgi:hypothetical protein
MPQPTTSDVHVDAVLTNMSVAYIQNQAHFVAGQVFPTVPVEKQSDKYFIYTKGDWFRDEAQLRAPGTESAGSGYTLSTDTYSADVYAFHKDIDDQTRKNSDSPLNPDRDATQFVTQRMLMRQEIDWFSTYFTQGVWETDVILTGTDQWNDASSDPIDVIETGKATILTDTGLMPNTLTVGYDVHRQLRNHPDIIDRVKYTSGAPIGNSVIADFFGIDRYLVSMGIKNTAAEGVADVMANIAGKHALLTHSASSPSTLTPSAGYCFKWRGISDGLNKDVGITRMRMASLRSDRIEAQMAWDNKVVALDLGYFIANAVA